MIIGEEIKLIKLTVTGHDSFGMPICTEQAETIKNVCVGNPSTDAVVQDMNLYGRRLSFVLGIPKGDNNDWENAIVEIRGKRFRTYGEPITQTEANVPGYWNTQVKVERYG